VLPEMGGLLRLELSVEKELDLTQHLVTRDL
jgi:hypothetical protein